MPIHLARTSLLPLVTLLAAHAAQAGTLSVRVSDEAGHPLADAVVMLDPVSGKLPVKPLPQTDISQAKRQFSPLLTVVTVGTAVNFPNFDTVRHQVYSFSPIKTFELKLYAGVPSKPIVFDKAGAAVLGCSIHDRMAAWVVVVDTPLYARSGADGLARIEGLTNGSYLLRAWHAGVPAGKEPAPLAIEVSGPEAEVPLKLNASPL